MTIKEAIDKLNTAKTTLTKQLKQANSELEVKEKKYVIKALGLIISDLKNYAGLHGNTADIKKDIEEKIIKGQCDSEHINCSKEWVKELTTLTLNMINSGKPNGKIKPKSKIVVESIFQSAEILSPVFMIGFAILSIILYKGFGLFADSTGEFSYDKFGFLEGLGAAVLILAKFGHKKYASAGSENTDEPVEDKGEDKPEKLEQSGIQPVTINIENNAPGSGSNYGDESTVINGPIHGDVNKNQNTK